MMATSARPLDDAPPPATSPVPPQQLYEQLIHKMLTEDRPVVAPSVNTAMVNVLSDDRACATLLRYITRTSADAELLADGPRPQANKDPQPSAADLTKIHDRAKEDEAPNQISTELMASYRATMLLTNDDTSDALLSFLGAKSKLLTRCLFAVFEPSANGNLRHGCRVLDYLLRLYLDSVYEVLSVDVATVERFLGNMLAYLEHPAVAESFVTLICKPPSAALTRGYASTPQKKWAFYRAVSEWKVLLQLAQHVCRTDYPAAHNVGAADAFIELLDRLAADENGALLLQPVAHCPELLGDLIAIAVDRSLLVERDAQRAAAMRCVLGLLQKSALDRVQGPPTGPYQTFGSTIINMVPNQLAPLRQRVFELAEEKIDLLLRFLLDQHVDQQKIAMDQNDPTKLLPPSAVRHSAYVVKVPFTEFRLDLVNTLLELVAYDPSQMAKHFDIQVWRVLLAWFFEYAHNNLYHAAFYQFVFIALRTNDVSTLEVMLKKLKLVTTLIEHYRKDGPDTSNRGYILQCCNAIRLQASSQAPDAFLRNFLQSHTTWRGFEEELRTATSRMSVRGLGMNVPQPMPGFFQPDVLPATERVEGIDHGSDFARALGFVDDVAWPDECNGSDGARTRNKKKKKSKGKRKASNASQDAAPDDDTTEDSKGDKTDDNSTGAPPAPSSSDNDNSESEGDDEESSTSTDASTTNGKKSKGKSKGKKKKKSKSKGRK